MEKEFIFLSAAHPLGPCMIGTAFFIAFTAKRAPAFFAGWDATAWIIMLSGENSLERDLSIFSSWDTTCICPALFAQPKLIYIEGT